MTSLLLLDDAAARAFEPFALSRPVSALRAGGLLLGERWQTAMGERITSQLIAPHLTAFSEPDAIPVFSEGTVQPGSILINTRCAPALQRVPSDAGIWECNGRIAAIRCATAVDVSQLTTPGFDLASLADPDSPRPRATIDGWWLDHIWDLVRVLPDMLCADITALAPSISRGRHDASVIGGHEVIVEDGAFIEPHVVFDATSGPILIRRGASVAAFSRVVGPCFVGTGSAILGGKVSGSSIGDTCRVHGEVSSTIFIGHANKGHDGFVGHSMLGRWTNLGASTVTSNLKNTYGNVQLWTPNGVTDTGMQFLGSLMGDHAKTAIGTRLTTGAVIGAGANVVADGFVPKVVEPFSWGPTGAASRTYELEKFLEVAARVMSRRQVTLDESGRAYLTQVYLQRWHADA